MEHELRFEVVPELKKQQYNTEEIIEELKRSMEDITQISEKTRTVSSPISPAIWIRKTRVPRSGRQHIHGTHPRRPGANS